MSYGWKISNGKKLLDKLIVVLICTRIEPFFVKNNTFIKIKVMCVFSKFFVNMNLDMKNIYDEIYYLRIAKAGIIYTLPGMLIFS
jgi:hypothetical protein